RITAHNIATARPTMLLKDAVTLLKLFGEGLKIVGQGLLTTASIALVEETLFRSWLPEEIAVDLGFNRGIILSGLAFSLCQWSLKAIPGLWLLSLGLSGVRQRCQGSLSVPIGLRTGIMASSFVLKEGGFLIYQPTYPLWLCYDTDCALGPKNQGL
nr:alpha/beta hydrolase fold protein [Tanacetum cinerariifolium]